VLLLSQQLRERKPGAEHLKGLLLEGLLVHLLQDVEQQGHQQQDHVNQLTCLIFNK
jgi:hypothetical protein